MDWRSFWSLVATSVSKRIRLDSIGRGNRGKKTKKKKKVAGRKGARRKGGESSELPVVGRYAYSTCAFLRPLTRKTSKSLSSSPRVNRVADSPVRNPTRDRLYRATFSPQEKHAVRSLPPPSFPPLVSQASRGRRARSTLPLRIVTSQPTDHLTDPILFNRRLKNCQVTIGISLRDFTAIKS